MEEKYNFVYIEDKKFKWFDDPCIQQLLMKWYVQLHQIKVYIPTLKDVYSISSL
jgi:hypothetical protein